MFALLTGNTPLLLLCFLLIAACIALGYVLYVFFFEDKQTPLEWPKLDNVGTEE